MAAASVLLAACTGGSSTAGGDEVECGSAPPEVTTHRYAEIDGVAANLTSVDVWATPNAQGCPLIVYVHGGSWQEGDKATRATRVKAEHFVANGFAFASMNYRLAQPDNDVRWPSFGDDVAAAVGWLQSSAPALGLDTDSVILMGHSAGAHLVSITGTHPTLLAQAGADVDDVACVVSLDSVTHDLTDEPAWETEIIELAFASQADRIDGSPTLQIEAMINAGSSFDGPSFLIVTRGRAERIESSERLAVAITEAGGRAEVADVSPYDHRDANVRLGVAGETVLTPVVDRFVAQCIAPER